MKKFSASSAAQLIACPGSGNLELAIPGWQEPVRDDMAGAKGIGTIVHALLEPALQDWSTDIVYDMSDLVHTFSLIHWRKRRPIEQDVSKMFAWLKQEAVTTSVGALRALDWFMDMNQHQFPPRQLVFISQALAYVGNLREIAEREATSHLYIFSEESFTANWLAQPTKTTVDGAILYNNQLEVIDYKNGTIPVSAAHNDQMLFYAACLLEEEEEAQPIETITLHIVQPKNCNSWTITRAFLQAWITQARKAQLRIIDEDRTLVPGDHCTFCPANPHTRGDRGTPLCPAMLEVLYPGSASDTDEDSILNL